MIFKGLFEERIDILREKDLTGQDEKDKKLNIVKCVKKAKDFLVYDVKKLSDASERLLLLGECLAILKKLKR